MSEALLNEVKLIAVAEFVEEGLAGLGILDDADEILHSYYEEGGFDSVKKAQKYYNNAIAFVNETLDDPNRTIAFITDAEVLDWFSNDV